MRGDTVGIVGAGAFGCGLAAALGRANRPVVLWSRDGSVVRALTAHRTSARLPGVQLATSVRITDDPRALAAEARLLVLAVASTDARARALALGEFLDGNHIVVHAVGALTAERGERVSAAVAAGVATQRIGALAGPALPHDMANGAFASMVVASAFTEVVDEARRLLNVPPALRVYGSTDLLGVEYAAALAGAYAITLGLVDGMGLGSGVRAVVISRAMAEAARICGAVGAQPRTVTGLAGLGNLLVRADAATPSAEYAWGRTLAQQDTIDAAPQLEGVRAALTLAAQTQRLGVSAPLLQGLAAVLRGEQAPAAAAQLVADSVAAAE